MNNVSFCIIDSKSRFEEMVKYNEVDPGSIVLIQDTGELWVHGIYIGTVDITLYNGLDCTVAGKALDARQGKTLSDRINQIKWILDWEVLPTDKARRDQVKLTQAEYDERVANGTIFNDTVYYIVNPESTEE